MHGNHHDRFVTRQQLADIYPHIFKENTLANWASQKKGPPFTNIGGGKTAQAIYDLVLVERYIAKNIVADAQERCPEVLEGFDPLSIASLPRQPDKKIDRRRASGGRGLASIKRKGAKS
ncbi:hypothetical protein V5T82_16880 [Magnetovibrio sp. PR-2]|uniref:hypothetical protein n=1 Tax=Magnetovibrio sp. PR-2 TaxID=3120356 RepID=UPI002FCE6867